MINFISKLARLVAGGLFTVLILPTIAHGALTLNVDMDHGATESGTAAAPDSGTIWNSITTGGTLNTVLDSQGNTRSGVSIAFSSADGSYRLYNDTTSGSPNPLDLMSDYTYGDTYTLKISGLTPGQAYGLYAYSHGNKDNQTGTITLAAANGGASASTSATGNATEFRNIYRYGWGYTYVILDGTADSAGTFTFTVNNYLNGFQLQRLSAPGISGLTNQTIVAGTTTVLSPAITGTPEPFYQWLANGVAMDGETNATLGLADVQYSQSGTVYSLIATNVVGAATNNMTLSVIVTPAIAGLNNQAASTGSTVTMAPVVSGVPTPSVQWLFNGNLLSDGATGNGSTIKGSGTATLVIDNAQTADSGTYSLVATNTAGRVTNSMTLTVASGNVAPTITGPVDQTVVQGSNATFGASVAGLPIPTRQWLVNGILIAGATNSSLTLTNVKYSQNGNVYSLSASNAAGSTTNSASLHVLVPPHISASPTDLVVTNTQPATFSTTASGVPAPAYQWYFKGNLISGATASSYTISHATPSNMGSYYVVVSSSVGTVTSAAATLTVNSTMAATTLWPVNGATNICYDTPLRMTFNSAPVIGQAGQIRIYNAADPSTPVDSLDMSLNATLQAPYAVNVQTRKIGGNTFNTFPVIVHGDTVTIYPHLDTLASNQTYYVTVDNGVFTDGSGANFAGLNSANAWRFTTKPTGPANPTNLVVAADGGGDFATVQGAVDSVPANNTIPTTIHIRNGVYTEIVDVNSKNNLLFVGQSRAGTIIGYPNNNNVNAGAPQRSAFVMDGNDCAFENLTITNMTPKGGSQAEAVDVEGSRVIFYNMNLDSYQDTFLVHSAGKLVYFRDCLIQGDTDFNWGYGTVFWTNCELRVMSRGGHVTQPRSPAGQNGFSFVNCTVTAANSGVTSADLGRSIHTSDTPAEVIFAQCKMGDFITGYASDAGTNFWDYADSNLTVTLPKTLAYSTHLNGGSPVVVAALSATNWLYGWQPQLASVIIRQPADETAFIGRNTTLSVEAAGIPKPSYQWLKDGTVLAGETNASLNLDDVQAADAGTYSVVISNAVGTVKSQGAKLTVANAPSLLHARRLSNGNIQFAIEGPAGLGYRIWATTNLSLSPVTNTWTLVTNEIFGGNASLFTDSRAMSLSQRFYMITVP